MSTKQKNTSLENLPGECCIYEAIDEIRCKQPEDEIMYDLADLFKVFGDSTRIKILFGLEQAEMCVAHIAEMLDMSQSATSHQLRVLKENKLVKSRRVGKQVYYSLDDDHVHSILRQGLEHVLE